MGTILLIFSIRLINVLKRWIQLDADGIRADPKALSCLLEFASSLDTRIPVDTTLSPHSHSLSTLVQAKIGDAQSGVENKNTRVVDGDNSEDSELSTDSTRTPKLKSAADTPSSTMDAINAILYQTPTVSERDKCLWKFSVLDFHVDDIAQSMCLFDQALMRCTSHPSILFLIRSILRSLRL